jgi:hypothetical protein
MELAPRAMQSLFYFKMNLGSIKSLTCPKWRIHPFQQGCDRSRLLHASFHAMGETGNRGMFLLSLSMGCFGACSSLP